MADLKRAFNYYDAMEGKNIRKLFLDIIQKKYKINDLYINEINHIINIIHTSSLIIDDIQDNSVKRRGNMCAHIKYGIDESINASYLAIFDLLDSLDVNFAKNLITKLREMHVGQGYDIYYSKHKLIPDENTYLDICEKKTGKLFEIIIEYLFHKKVIDSDDKEKMLNLCKLFSHYYQIRDDYINLTSDKYWKLKGYCEDLDNYNINYCLVLMQDKNTAISSNIMKLISEKPDGYKNTICKILNDNLIFWDVEEKLTMLKKSINSICDFSDILKKLE
jgi:geranylgeranyl pyrophosphate synthase